ncbi:MAG: sulfite exporter TauE/SafE family protein [Anaerolineaceae bacterium]|nr:sulfite exporter TauE/SafE family protein [Anaerolineaceae bacterium]
MALPYPKDGLVVDPMNSLLIALLSLIFLVTAILYSAVGQAGGTGYLAAMALFGIAPEIMRPTTLILNILVAAIASLRYYRSGCFSWGLFWPFAITSIPFAFLGGSLALPGNLYKILVGLVLIFTAFYLTFQKLPIGGFQQRPISIPLALLIGAAIGGLAGLTGVGGGIFLSPVLLLLGWSELGQASGISALFILVNSISGLFGNLTSMRFIPPEIPYWFVAAAIGGWIGADYGSRHLNSPTLTRILGLVMVLGGIKLMVF